MPENIGREQIRVRLGRRVRMDQLPLQIVGHDVAEVEARRSNCDAACSVVGVGHMVDAPCAG